MFTTVPSRLGFAAAIALAGSAAMASPFAIDTGSSSNGLYSIFSTTLDSPTFGGLTPCTGGSPSYCAFFGGDAPLGRNISLSPSPSGVSSSVPVGISPVPVAGSFLDLTLSGGNTSVTINGGTITSPAASLVIQNNAGPTTVTTNNTGWVFTVGGSGAIDVNGQAEILVNSSPALAADFSTLSAAVTGCTGPLCGVLGLLSLDMVRYRLFLDFNPDFSAFTGQMIGQTSNGSLIYANLNSTLVPVPAAVWLMGSAIGLLGWIRRRAVA